MRTRDGTDREPGGVELRLIASPPPPPPQAPGPPAWKRREVARLDDWRRAREARLRREAREAEDAEWRRTHPERYLGIRWKCDPLAYRWLREQNMPYHMTFVDDMVAAQESRPSAVGYEIPNPEWARSDQYAKFRVWLWGSWDEKLPEGVIPHAAVVPASIAIGRRSRKFADSPHISTPLSPEGVRAQLREDER